jgi:hypothetical protein
LTFLGVIEDGDVVVTRLLQSLQIEDQELKDHGVHFKNEELLTDFFLTVSNLVILCPDPFK